MDLYNNEILSWNFQRKMDMSIVMSGLEKIPARHLKGSIVHTDRRKSVYKQRNEKKT